MAKSPPPSPEDIARVLAEARLKMPKTPISLGCMRPVGTHRSKTDVYAVEAGVNGIAFPSEQGVKQAESLGLSIVFSPTCCCKISEDLNL